jgi:hypothetical protein
VRRLIALAVLGVVLVLLIVAQLALPSVAEQELRDQLSQSGTVLSVNVSAFPAIKLLWHHADSVDIRMGTYRTGAGQLADRLGQTAGVGRLDASVSEFRSGALTLRDATLRKRGSELVGTATVLTADLRAAVPFLEDVQPIASQDGQLVLRGTANLLGLRASVDATVSAQNGALVVAPNVPFGGIATITLFSDPHVQVESVNATRVPGGFSIQAVARVH